MEHDEVQVTDRLLNVAGDLSTAQRLVREREASLGRIRAAAESDADLEKLPALRGFLLQETKAVEHGD